MEKQLESRLIDGNYTKNSNVVARCHVRLHRGYLSKSLVKSHQCIAKKCPFFQKLKPEYWEALEASLQGQKERRQRLKQATRTEAARDLFIKETLEANGCIHVTSIREKSQNILTITYIYDLRIDLSDEISLLRTLYNKRIELSASPGTRETIEKLIKVPRRENRITTDVRKAPRVGNATKKRLASLGVYCLEDLYGRTAKDLYSLDCKQSGTTVNRRYFAAYQSAVGAAHAMGIKILHPPTQVSMLNNRSNIQFGMVSIESL